MESGKLPMGIVLPDLASYQKLVRVLSDEATVSHHEFTYRAPLFKFNDDVVERLKDAKSALEKFDVYYEAGILDEKTRVGLAQKFRADYARKHPGSEASDLFFASGDVLGFSLALKQPRDLGESEGALLAITKLPHDDDVRRAVADGDRVDDAHLLAEFRLFLDHPYNPRRRELEVVQAVMTGARRHDPVIVEMMTSGAIPGYFHYAVEGAIDEVDGALVMLPG